MVLIFTEFWVGYFVCYLMTYCLGILCGYALRWVFGFVVLEEMGLEFEGRKTTERVGEMGSRRRGSSEAMVATGIILYLTKVINEKRKRPQLRMKVCTE